MPFRETNPRRRTKDEMVRDILTIRDAALSYAARYDMLHGITWQWSEFEGKYRGVAHWSDDALDLYLQSDGNTDGLRHEHIVPRSVVIAELMGGSGDHEAVRSYLDSHLLGAIVTEGEMARLDRVYRKQMPRGYHREGDPLHRDVWARYKVEQIPMLVATWGLVGRRLDLVGTRRLFEAPAPSRDETSV